MSNCRMCVAAGICHPLYTNPAVTRCWLPAAGMRAKIADMVRFLVLWDTPSDPAAFDRHYREVHIPLARKLPGLRRYSLSRNAVAIRGGEPFYLVAELEWDTMDDLHAAFGSEQGQATAADVAELATGGGVRSMVFEVEALV